MLNIGMPYVWARITGRPTVYVAVIDSGIAFHHPDLSTNIGRDSNNQVGRRFFHGGTWWDNNPIDTDGHGTHVAGIIGAVGNNNIGVTGVNWVVRMLAVDVLSNPGTTGLAGWANLTAGINYVIAERRNGKNIRVANLSLGGRLHPQHLYLSEILALRVAIEALSNEDIVVVMAAGNDGQDLNTWNYNFYPAAFRFANTISVGAIGTNSQRGTWAGGSSNVGNQWVDIAAPGVSIYSTTIGNTYESRSGTSMAAPHVAGAVAILSAAFPDESASQIRGRILRGARNIGVPTYWRYGTLDVWNAFRLPVIPAISLPAGRISEAYYHAFNANSIEGWQTTLSIDSGSLPPGLHLHSIGAYGVIYGVPTTTGTFNFAIRAANTTGSTGSTVTPFSIIIDANSGVALTGGFIEAGGVAYSNGDTFFEFNIGQGDMFRFIPTPPNATINSIEWCVVGEIPFYYTNRIATPIGFWVYGGENTYVSVFVNGTYVMFVKVHRDLTP
jgi:hypothetical protein